MSETFAFELKLVSDIEKVAKRQIEPLRKLEQQADKTKTALSKGFADQWSKIGMAADRASFKHQQAFAGSWEKIGMAAEKAAGKQRSSFADSWSKIGAAAERAHKRQQDSAERGAKRQQSAFANAWAKIGMAADRERKKEEEKAERLKERTSFAKGIKEGFGFEKIASAAFVGTVVAESMIEGAKSAVEIIGEGISSAFEEASRKETLSLGARLTLGAKGSKEFGADVGRFSKLTGFDDDAIMAMLLPQRRAGFSQKAARTNFAIASDLAAQNGRGGDQQFVAGILDTLTDIKLKGGIGEKRLVGMGVNAPDFYKSLAKQLGKSAKTVRTDLEQGGKIDPQIVINAIGKSVEKTQGGTLGTGAIAFGKTMEARLSKLGELPGEYLKAIAESPEWTKLADRIGEFLERMDPDSPDGQRIVGSLLGAFDKLEKMVETALKPESIDAFVAGVQKAVDAVGGLVSLLRETIDLLNGETLSKALFEGDQGDEKLALIARKKREIATGQLTGLEKKQREMEIASLEKTLTPSERADLAAQTNRTTPSVSVPVAQRGASGGGKVIQLNVHPGAVVVHAQQGEDPNHTAQKTGEQVHRHVQAALEKAAQAGGG